MRYNPDSGELIWIKKTSPKSRITPGQKVGVEGVEGYLQTKIYQKQYKVHRLIWFIYYGEWPKNVIDHIDGNPSNNRISNLRQATFSQNSANKRKSHMRKNKPLSSKYKGVSWISNQGKWKASIKCKEIGNIILGLFENEFEAAEAYNKAAIKYFKTFAKVN